MSDTTTPSIFQSQPIAAAGGVIVAVEAFMAALWAVVGDAGAIPWLTHGTQGLITFAVLAVVTVVAATWAQRRSTSTAKPTLVAGTPIQVVDAQGATLGHAPLATPADPDA